MHKFFVILILLAAFCATCARASPITIGINSKARPGQAEKAEDIVNGIKDLGTGVYANLVTLADLQDLKDPDEPRTLLRLDATDIPATLCTNENVAIEVAKASCSTIQNAPEHSATNLRLIYDKNNQPDVWLWNCEQITNPGNPFWVAAECP